MHELQKPIQRSLLRSFLGKEFYILKRRYHWASSSNNWASEKSSKRLDNSVFEHRSLILRPLKDVDMYLQENKRTNLRLAIRHLNGIMIGPGETFSLWKLVGRPTKRKGYLEGLVLKQGSTAKDTGGGLCQLGNLLFWMFAHSPLTITERHRHGFDVFPDVNRKVPFGAGATLSYNHIDLQVKNKTNQVFQLDLFLDDTHLNGRLLSEEVLEERYHIEERDHTMKQQMWGGYSRHNRIVRVVETEDGEAQEELLVENHAVMMYNPFLEASEKNES